jgi:hypothetical protein
VKMGPLDKGIRGEQGVLAAQGDDRGVIADADAAAGGRAKNPGDPADEAGLAQVGNGELGAGQRTNLTT